MTSTVTIRTAGGLTLGTWNLATWTWDGNDLAVTLVIPGQTGEGSPDAPDWPVCDPEPVVI